MNFLRLLKPAVAKVSLFIALAVCVVGVAVAQWSQNSPSTGWVRGTPKLNSALWPAAEFLKTKLPLIEDGSQLKRNEDLWHTLIADGGSRQSDSINRSPASSACTEVMNCRINFAARCQPTECPLWVVEEYPGHLKCMARCAGQEPGVVDFVYCGVCPRDPATANSTNSLGTKCSVRGSVISVEDQVLGEVIPIAATDTALVYFTDRSQSRRGSYHIKIPWYGTDVPEQVTQVKFHLEAAGKIVDQTFAPQTGLTFEYLWDGRDSTGRLLQAGTVAHVQITETVTGLGDVPTHSTYNLNGWRAKAIGLGGWNLSSHHFYNKEQGRIYYGFGGSRLVPPRVNAQNQIQIPSEDGAEIFVFNQAGEHLSTRLSLKGELLRTFEYDGARRLTAVNDPFGNRLTIERDANGNPTAIVSPFGQRSLLTLDTGGNLKSVQDPNANVHAMTYAGSLLKTFKRPGGQTSTFTYDAEGLLLKDAHSSGRSQTLTPTSPGNLTMTSAMGQTTTIQSSSYFDGTYGRHVTVGGATSSYQVTPNGRASQDWQGVSIQEQLSEDARFDKQLLVASQTNYGTVQQTLTENWGNEIIRSSSDIFSTTSYQEVTESDSRQWIKTYDAASRTWTFRSPLGRLSSIVVDANGRPTSLQSGGFLPVTLTYDARNRISQIQQGSRLSTFSYNVQGLLEKWTNPLSQMIQFGYDNGGRLVSQTNHLNQVTAFGYDANDRLVRITPPDHPAHLMTPNAFELLGQYLPPTLTGVTKVSTEFTYNKDEQLTKITKPSGRVATYTYFDPIVGNLTSIQTPEGTFSTSQITGTQKFSAINAPDGINKSLTYNGPLVSEIRATDSVSGAAIGNVQTSFDSQFRPSVVRVEGAGSSAFSDVSYQYDNDGLLTLAGTATLSRSVASGRLTQVNFNGITTTFTDSTQFPELSRLESKRGATVLYRAILTRDSLGRITQKQETTAGVTTTYVYEFDGAGRLVRVRTGSATGPIQAEYGYDANGSRLTVNRSGVTTSSTYDAQDRILSYGTTTFVHSADGDRTKRTQGAVNTNYTFGFFGNLRSVVTGSRRVDYLSDGSGLRVVRKVNGVVTQRWIYDEANRIVGETDAAGTLTKRFVFASRGHVPDQMLKSDGTYAIITDHLGSVRLVVNTAPAQSPSAWITTSSAV